ncbi:MAG: metallophosphoesterase [Candidatus Thermoplasmatota archaeon]|nr:metallophosphoesterase [Candidatus Thermoplasmatota archaeon]
MELSAYTPEMSKSFTFDADEVRIMFIQDIQYMDEMDTDVSRLVKYLDWGLDHDCYFLGLGDYIDAASPSSRAAILQLRAKAYDSVRQLIDMAAHDVLDELWEVLEQTAGHWLGLLKGHHYYRFESGETSDSVLADRLRTSLLGNCAMLALKLGKGSWKRTPVARIWAHHGAGGGITPGSALNRLVRIAETFNADVYVIGHQHKTTVALLPWLEEQVTRGKPGLVGSKRLLLSVGGFLRAYQEGRTDLTGEPSGGYVERGMYLPHALGTAVVKLRPIGTRVDIGMELL